MVYKIRVILDVEEDVFRDIIFESSQNLEQLHLFIAKSFGFNGQEMASFYTTDDEWNQNEEISLFDMSENGDGKSMQNCSLQDLLIQPNDKLIYVYDFLAMWSFFIELKEIKDQFDGDIPSVSLSFGNTPESAPEKEFTAEINLDDPYADEFGDGLDDDEFGSFENIDDYDL